MRSDIFFPLPRLLIQVGVGLGKENFKGKTLLNINKNGFYRIYAAVIFIILTTSLNWFLNDNSINLLMIAVMFTTPFLLVILFPYFKKDEIIFLLLVSTIFISALLNYSSFRLSTVMYSAIFVITFVFYRRLLFTGAMTHDFYLKLIKIIIYAYAIVLIIQQLSTIMDIPVFNKYLEFPNKFKLNSLALEPSHTGRILLLLIYSFMMVKESLTYRKYSLQNLKKDKFVWLAFLYVMLNCGSSLAIIALCLLGLYLFVIRNNINVFLRIIVIVFMALGFIYYGKYFKIESFQRIYKFVPAIITFDTDSIKETDLSASARIIPVFFYFDWADIKSKEFWLGHGVDYSRENIVSAILNKSYTERGRAAGGVFPAFFLDYGLIAGLIFLVCLRKMTMRRWMSFPMLMWLIIFLSNPFNTYIQWAYFIVMTTTLYFQNILSTRRLDKFPVRNDSSSSGLRTKHLLNHNKRAIILG